MAAKRITIRWIWFFIAFLFAYVIAALAWWYIALNQENNKITKLELEVLYQNHAENKVSIQKVQDKHRRKQTQFIAEGLTFFIIIIGGGIFIVRLVRNEFKRNKEEQQFMMAITHELKTPLAVTKLNLETLQKHNLPAQKTSELIKISVAEINRLNALINNLLLNNQLTTTTYKPSFETVNVSEVVKQVSKSYRNSFSHERNFNEHINESITVWADALLLQLAVSNLIDNAIKYSPKQKPITIKVSEGKDGFGKPQVRIDVIDEGQGVPEHEKQNIFSKYYRIGNEATKKAKGTGLGLYLVDVIIKKMGGRVLVSNNMPQGSIFTIVLPMAKSY